MGFTIQNSVELKNGVELKDLYVTIKGSYIVNKQFFNPVTPYQISYELYYYIDRTKPPVFQERQSIQLALITNPNLYGVIYGSIKQLNNYVNITDEM